MATLAGSRIPLLDEHTAALDPGTAAFVPDVSGEQRSGLDVPDLLALFARRRGGEDLTDDRLLIGWSVITGGRNGRRHESRGRTEIRSVIE